VDAQEIARLEPHLARPPARALHLTGDGAVDPVACTQALVGAACARGARLLTACATRVRIDAGRVVGVHTSSGFLPATSVVLAAGVDTPMLCAPLGLDLPVAPSPALLVRVTGPPGLVRTLVATPDMEVRELAPGRLVVAAGYGGETGEQQLLRAGEEVRSRLAAAFTGADGLRLDGVRLGARPMPVDGLPVVGPVPGAAGVHVAVMHSGVTLAPAAAALLAPEVVGGAPAGELAGVRPARFAGRAG
jgi:glycine/D-amino acid oxidase-like deaminating enzyme